MISIRSSVFETNSSSCHSITICPSDLKRELQSYQAIYVGPYDFSGCDYEYTLNRLDWSGILYEEDVKAKLDLYKSFGEPTNPYSKKNWQWLQDHDYQSMTLKEICNDSDFSLFDVLGNLDIEYTHESYLFGGVDRNDVCAENTFVDPTQGENMTISVIISEN